MLSRGFTPRLQFSSLPLSMHSPVVTVRDAQNAKRFHAGNTTATLLLHRHDPTSGHTSISPTFWRGHKQLIWDVDLPAIWGSARVRDWRTPPREFDCGLDSSQSRSLTLFTAQCQLFESIAYIRMLSSNFFTKLFQSIRSVGQRPPLSILIGRCERKL